MNQTTIGDNCELNKAIIAEETKIGNNVKLGVGEEAENDTTSQSVSSKVTSSAPDISPFTKRHSGFIDSTSRPVPSRAKKPAVENSG